MLDRDELAVYERVEDELCREPEEIEGAWDGPGDCARRMRLYSGAPAALRRERRYRARDDANYATPGHIHDAPQGRFRFQRARRRHRASLALDLSRHARRRPTRRSHVGESMSAALRHDSRGVRPRGGRMPAHGESRLSRHPRGLRGRGVSGAVQACGAIGVPRYPTRLRTARTRLSHRTARGLPTRAAGARRAGKRRSRELPRHATRGLL